MSINQRAKDMGVSDLVDRIEKLEEENRELRLENAKLRDRIITDENFEDKLDEENKKLSEENGQLKEKKETLELRLDNKEKLNEEYRKQLDYRHHRAMKAERGGEDDS